MLLEIKIPMAGVKCYDVGEIIDWADVDEAQRLIAVGYAVAVASDQPTIQTATIPEPQLQRAVAPTPKRNKGK